MDNTLPKDLQKKLPLGLFFIRATLALVFFVWAFDKLFNTAHTQAVFAGFYGFDISTTAAIGLGVVQLAFVAIFAAGLFKNVTYLLILLMHAGSTFVSMGKYLDPFNNLLFFAAWPMLGAAFILYSLREYDTFLALGKVKPQQTLASES